MTLRPLFLSVGLLVAGTAFAQSAGTTTTAMPKAEQRQANQERRIEQGKASGQLTQQEAARLEKREAKVDGEIAKAQADGKVTKGERRKIQAHQDANSRAVARKKHNKKKAPPATKPAN